MKSSRWNITREGYKSQATNWSTRWQLKLGNDISCVLKQEKVGVIGIFLKRSFWKSADIKTAFLQGETFDKEVYHIPPSDAILPQGYLWCLQGLSVVHGQE